MYRIVTIVLINLKADAHMLRANNSGIETMLSALRKYIADESGATAIEYALIASLIAVAIIASITVIGTQLQNTFNEVSSNLK